MNRSTKIDVPSPIDVKRFPWMRRIHLHSPKARRSVTLFSYPTLHLWALVESRPSIARFCEYPGYVIVNDERVLADFWAEGDGQQQYMVLVDGLHLEPEYPSKVPVFPDAPVNLLRREQFEPYQEWIDNWFHINPYIVANARFVTAQLLDRIRAALGTPRALYDLEHALRDFDPQLVRTGLFMLLHQGALTSDDLLKHPLSGATVFCIDSTPPAEVGFR